MEKIPGRDRSTLRWIQVERASRGWGWGRRERTEDAVVGKHERRADEPETREMRFELSGMEGKLKGKEKDEDEE
jgi:hypothetical protein